jgi:DNA-binding transcriptional ArsR family regulator
MTLHNEPRTLVLTRPEQLQAMSHPVRTLILQALSTEAASAKRLSERLGMTHGKVGYHLKVLEREGLAEVVEERKVRAMTERVFAPTYDFLHVRVPGAEGDRLQFLLEQAAIEAAPGDEQPFDDFGRLYSIPMPVERAAEFAARLIALADEFADASEPGRPVFGFAGAVYRTTLPEESS